MSHLRMIGPFRWWRQPGAGATLLSAATLAVALGANTAVFSLFDALVWRSVPFSRPGELVVVSSAFPSIKLSGMGLSGPEALELQTLSRAFQAVGPVAFASVTGDSDGRAEPLTAIRISSGAADALRLSLVAGRGIDSAEYAGSGRPVAIIGHGYWQRAFGGQPVLGRSIRIDGAPREIVGIASPQLSLLNRQADVWLPIPEDTLRTAARADHGYTVVGRLATDHTLSTAGEDLRRAMGIWQIETGELHAPTERFHPLEARGLDVVTTGLSRQPARALVAAVIFLLLLACANVANLMVARNDRRRGEFGIRLALGASKPRLLAAAAIEGVVMCMTACVAGLGIAYALIQGVIAVWPAAATAAPTLDVRVLLASALLSVFAGLAIGIAPLVRLSPGHAIEWLRAGGRGHSHIAGRQFQHSLVALQIAVALALSSAAGLMVRSLWGLTTIDTGLNPDNVVRAQIGLAQDAYPGDAAVWGFYERVVSRVSALPGVTGAAVMSGLPPLRRANNTSFLLDGREVMDHTAIKQVEFIQHVSPGYARVVGIPLLDGRDLLSTDHDQGAPVALINRTLADRLWPGASPLGRRLKPAAAGPWFTVVGVLADVKQAGLQEPAGGEVYVTHRQARLLLSGFLPRTMNLVVKTAGDIAGLRAALAQAIRDDGPGIIVSDVVELQAAIDRTVAQPRILAWAFTIFATIALLVAALGVYAVTAYTSALRTREFGVRVALGADGRDVMRLVMRSAATAVITGLGIGSAAAAGGAHLLKSLLFGVAPLDPIAMTASLIVITLAACSAIVLPARRAAQLDPVRSLAE